MTLTQLRANRTRESNRVRRLIEQLTHDPDNPQWRSPDGLPLWWPFWSDVLYDRVRETVRAARQVQAAECAEIPRVCTAKTDKGDCNG